MSIADPVQTFLDATVAIVNADTELRTLFGRTSKLIVKWATLARDHAVPVIAYQNVVHTPLAVNTDRLELQFSVFAASGAVANAAAHQLSMLLRTPAYLALGLDIARDPDNPAVRSWPDAEGAAGDVVTDRADIGLTFLITG